HVVTADQRGNGNSSLRPSRKINFGYKEQVEIEYPAILEAVKKRFPLSKIFIMGHSLGGQMGGMFAATRYDISGLILNASCSVYYKGWKGASAAGVLIGSQFSRVVSMLMGYFPGNRLGFGGKESRGVISDWAYTAYSGNFKAKGSDIDYNAAMKSCNVPVLALSYEGDTAAPYQSVKNLLEKFSSSATLQHHFNPESGGRKYDHYSWVRDPDLCIPVIQRWINSI
ncbi:MAG TPA: alpha/beta fold hydrolase, partial [Chitinophagaceae bacterium]|nr:alpha/beta fold hydrolase [Chitinophagaceae bacterium]